MLNKISFDQVIFRGLKQESKQQPQLYFANNLSKDVFHKSSGQERVSFKSSSLNFTGTPDLAPSLDRIFDRFNKPIIPREHLEKWLGQFEEADRPTAMKLLDNVDYHTYPDMINEVKELHQKVSEKLKQDGFDTTTYKDVDFSKIFSCKSGDVVSYLYRKTNKIRNTNFKTIEALKNEKPEGLKDKALVLLDDYIGTGV